MIAYGIQHTKPYSRLFFIFSGLFVSSQANDSSCVFHCLRFCFFSNFFSSSFSFTSFTFIVLINLNRILKRHVGNEKAINCSFVWLLVVIICCWSSNKNESHLPCLVVGLQSTLILVRVAYNRKQILFKENILYSNHSRPNSSVQNENGRSLNIWSRKEKEKKWCVICLRFFILRLGWKDNQNGKKIRWRTKYNEHKRRKEMRKKNTK